MPDGYCFFSEKLKIKINIPDLQRADVDLESKKREVTRLENSKVNLKSTVPVADSHPNGFGIWHFCWRTLFLTDCATFHSDQKSLLNLSNIDVKKSGVLYSVPGIILVDCER